MCLNTSFEDLVDENGCPMDKIYFGKINLEYLYTKEYNQYTANNLHTYNINYNYNNYLFEYSKTTTQDSYTTIGYKYLQQNYIITGYLGDTYSLQFDYLNNNFIYTLIRSYDEIYTSSIGATYFINNFSHSAMYNKNNIDKILNYQVSYNLTEKSYIKIGYDKYINEDIKNIYFGIGINFE
jgi:hypothetical protein